MKITLSLRRCLWMTGRSTVILEEGNITGSFIRVYCHQNKNHRFKKKRGEDLSACQTLPISYQKNDQNQGSKHTWIGSRNSSGISPRTASVSIASEAATLALAPSSINSCITLPSSPILRRTSAAALNNWSKLQLTNCVQPTIWFKRVAEPNTKAKQLTVKIERNELFAQLNYLLIVWSTILRNGSWKNVLRITLCQMNIYVDNLQKNHLKSVAVFLSSL